MFVSMKKLKIGFVLGLLLILGSLYGTVENVSASEIDEINPKTVNEENISVILENEESLLNTPENTSSENISTYMINPIRYRKKNVIHTTGWSSYKRVSDNLKTGSSGGSITANKSVTFNTSVTGSISGLTISTNSSVSSSKSYTLSVGKNQRVYIGYRTYYKIEKGVREQYDLETGKVYSKNNYTVKKPQYGEYALIKYYWLFLLFLVNK